MKPTSPLEQQRAFFLLGKTRSLDARRVQLEKLLFLTRRHEKEMEEALFSDLGKSKAEVFASEIALVQDEIKCALSHLNRWARPKRVGSPLSQWPSRARIQYEPKGCALVLGPWNYPVQLMLAPLVSALSAGCCVTLKPSELAPATSALLENILGKAFEPEWVSVRTGGVEVSQALLEGAWDHVFFTGSTEVGRKILAATSRHLTPTTLELGGKSPCVVDSDTDWEVTGRRIAWGKFLNVGQTCVAPDFVCVPKGRTQDLVQSLTVALTGFYGKDPALSPDYGRVINEGHFQRLEKLLEGTTIAFGGDRRKKEKYFSPTIVTGVSWDHPVMKEEIFGPILPVLEYESEELLKAQLLTLGRPLAFYVFSRNQEWARQWTDGFSFGGGCVNDTLIHLANPRLPFGGIGPSGMGGYHGEFGFQEFSHRKSLVVRGFFADFALRYPPYEKKLKWIRKFLG